MKTYFIADNDGILYRHDIKTEHAARCILDNILRDMDAATAKELQPEIFTTE